MKRVLIIFVLGLMAISLIAQTKQEEGARPAQFKTDQMQTLSEINVLPNNPICCFLSQEIEYPEISLSINEEGIVVVQFCIDDEGEVEDVQVVSSVSSLLDQVVVDAIQKTSGQWYPAQLNGRCLESTKKLYISFDIEGNRPHKEKAQLYFKEGMKNIARANEAKMDRFIDNKARQKKIDRHSRYAISKFEKASKYSPEESCFAFWKARAYENMGYMSEMKNSLDKYLEIVNGNNQVNKAYVTISHKK